MYVTYYIAVELNREIEIVMESRKISSRRHLHNVG